MAMSFNFILTGDNSKSGFVTGNSNDSKSDLSSNDSSENGATLITSTDDNCVDGFAGKDIMGTFDESKVTSDMMAETETAGSVAYNGAETAGSVAYNGAETIGSVACAGAETAGSVACADGGGGFSGGSEGFSSFG